jgi:hypothetical protein
MMSTRRFPDYIALAAMLSAPKSVFNRVFTQ